MWAIHKSPLIIGAAMDSTKLSATSLQVLSNEEVIAINQDSLAEQARLVLRYTEEEWDLWAGNLSGSRKVVGVSNWRNASQRVEVDLSVLGVSSAEARDVWTAEDVGAVSGTQTVDLAAHEMKLWVLSDISSTATPSGGEYYSATEATLSGSATVAKCGDGECEPVHSKVGYIAPGSSVTFSSVTASTSGKAFLGVDFINYDYAFSTAWAWGTNTRNMTVSVNGEDAKRWAFPLSGGDWYETGRMTIEVDGFVEGDENEVVFSVPAADEWAPDLVGFEVLE